MRSAASWSDSAGLAGFSAAPGPQAAFCLSSSAICMPTRQKIHFGKASQRACQGHDEAGNILKPLGCQCRAFLFIGTACCPMQANVNSAVTSAPAFQISSLILPAGSWNGRRVRESSGEGEAGGRTGSSSENMDFLGGGGVYFFFFFFAELNLFLPLPSPELVTAVRCQPSGAEQVAIANINGYYISIQERVQMICLLKHSH